MEEYIFYSKGDDLKMGEYHLEDEVWDEAWSNREKITMQKTCSEGLDDNGYIHRTFYDTDLETWTKYDENHNLIHHVISDGRETWQQYDENGKITYAKDLYIDGTTFEQAWVYDGFGKLIRFTNSNGYKYNWA